MNPCTMVHSTLAQSSRRALPRRALLPNPPAPGATQPERLVWEVLRLSARTRLSDEHAARVRSLVKQEGFDWEVLLQTAARSRMEPLLWRSLQRACAAEVPAAASEQLEHRRHANSQKSLFQAEELVRLVQLFKEEGLPVLPLKGLVLSRMAYGGIAARPTGDIDLLVGWKNFARAQAILRSNGYSRGKERSRLREAVHARFIRQTTFTRGAGVFKTQVDLHAKTQGRGLRVPSLERLCSRSETVKVNGYAVPCPSMADQLVLLSLHGTKHRWNYLKLVCDIAELAGEVTERDWDLAFAYARETGAERMLSLALLLARTELAVAIPAGVMRRAESSGVRPLLHEARRHLFEKTFHPERRGPSSWEGNRFQFRIRDSLGSSAVHLMQWTLLRGVQHGYYALKGGKRALRSIAQRIS